MSLLRWPATLLAGVLLAMLLALVVLAWRLSAGPIDVTALVRTLASGIGPASLEIGHASLAWNGWRRADAPFILSGEDLELHRAGAALDRLDATSVSVSPDSLLRLRPLPVALTLDGGTIGLQRRADGELDLAGFPPTARHSARGAPFLTGALEHVTVSGLRIEITDARSGLTLAATGVTADLDRSRPSAALAGTVRAVIEQRPVGGAEPVPPTPIEASMSPEGNGSLLAVHLGPVDPSRLAPLLAPLGAWHARASLILTLALDHALRPGLVTADVTSEAGSLAVGGSEVPFDAARLHLAAHLPGDADLALAVTLAGANGSPGPMVSAHAALGGSAARAGHLAGMVDLTATPISIPTIGTWWPAGIAHDARAWSIANLTGGTASNLDIHAALASSNGIAGLSLASITGGFDATGLELHWLAPIPPITGARAHLRIDDENSLTVTLASGHQGKLDVAGTRMRITGLTAKVQPADIDARVRGPLAAMLSVLNQRRLHLLSRQPFTLSNPSGSLDARLHVALPLDDRVTMDQIAIGAHVVLAHVHLGDVALGHSIEDGGFVLDANTNGLRMKGNASFASLPVSLDVGLDFRAGPPSQVTEHVIAGTRANGDAIRRASTEFGRVLGGIVALSADYRFRRDRHASLALDADLADATVATPFGWGKGAGPPASLHADLDIENGQLAAIDSLAAHGPGLDIATHGIANHLMGTPSGLSGLALDRIEIGRTRAAGRLDFPVATRSGFRLALSGPELDLAAMFGPPVGTQSRPVPPTSVPATPVPARTGRPATGQPWSANLAFARVTLAHHVDIGGVYATLDGSGADLRAAKASAAGPVPSTASIAMAGSGRVLDVRTEDAGRLLSAFDLTDRIRDGSLSVAATLPRGSLTGGMTGTVRLDNFTLLRVPAMVRLLRDLTVYGLADPARTPNISVSKVTVPFEWQRGVLTLDHATAWQPALGLTARGRIDTRANTLDLTGTIVPAYIVNTLPGRLPLVGHLFSPERGGGVFAATFTLKGPAGNPAVKVNPLAALLPGVLRHLLPH